ncbi:MAG: biosynthetic-type acetolactate synthase large subunit [Spirochaetia bacterium]|nr:biosynthetic-type acetolactate synthase large subunit [Spirochaetia bacterium]
MTVSGAQLLVKTIEKLGITYIAGIPGGANLPIYDALRNSTIQHILVRHEQAAAFVAQGMARVSRKPAFCMATSGPGATNLLTAIADAKLDSIPVVAITGQVSRHLIGTNAFQEVDICSMAAPVVKKSFQIMNAEDIASTVQEAFYLARSGRPGPVLIDIPRDIQLEMVTMPESNIDEYPVNGNQTFTGMSHFENGNDSIFCAIENSRKPVLYIGGGIVHSGASDALRAYMLTHKIPAVSTLMGLGSIDPENPYYLGMLGMHGAQTANLAMEEADLIIGIGVRFDDRATGDIQEFCKKAKFIHIDIDSNPLKVKKIPDYTWNTDALNALRVINAKTNIEDRTLWFNEILNIKSQINGISSILPNNSLLTPQNIIRSISNFLKPDDIISTDVGQHQMWVAQNYPFRIPGTFLTSGGLGTMGFGLPVAIGAALAAPQKTIACISGDGSILMNIQELATLAELGLNVKIVIFNNGHLGLVRQQQNLFFNQKYFACRFNEAPDFAQVASGFGISAQKITQKNTLDNLNGELENMMMTPGPFLLDIEINIEENVLPMVPPGQPNRVMIC